MCHAVQIASNSCSSQALGLTPPTSCYLWVSKLDYGKALVHESAARPETGFVISGPESELV
jgi:hypothetical protein